MTSAVNQPRSPPFIRVWASMDFCMASVSNGCPAASAFLTASASASLAVTMCWACSSSPVWAVFASSS